MNYISVFRIVIAGMIILAFFSCTATTEKKDSVIPVGEVFPTLTDLNAAQYFKKIRFIPMETTTESLIGKGPVWQMKDDYVVVTTE